MPAFVLDTKPGDAVLFDFRLWHGSWKGGADRRMFSLQYYKTPETESETAAMTSHVQGAVEQREEIREKGFQTKNKDGVFGLARGYPQYWLDNHPGNADRQRWIEFHQKIGLVGGEKGAPTTDP